MKTLIEHENVTTQIISPTDGHYFFGYYDLQPFDSTGRYHLCHKAPFEDHIPGPEDVCEVGMVDIETQEFISIGETTAWNFQQGAMLRWFKDDDHIIYNIREGNAWKSCIQNIHSKEKRILPMAIADLTADGTKAVCINFSRVFNFRPGYGYNGIEDPYYDVKAPTGDGIFIMDTETGECHLAASYDDIRRQFPKLPYSEEKLLVNHINWNPSGTRYAMLLRNFPTDGGKWSTILLTGDDRGNLRQMAEWATHSHYHWKNDRELLIVSTRTEGAPLGLYSFDDVTGSYTYYPDAPPLATPYDIHCLYSPDRTFVSGDGYPDKEGYRALNFINMDTNENTVLGRYYSNNSEPKAMEYRCDLHARFDRTGRYLSFDSNHIGNRCICRIDLSNLKEYWRAKGGTV